MALKYLLQNETSNATGDATQSSGILVPVIAVYGTFGGATVAIELSPDGVTWGSLKDATGIDIAVTAENVNIPAQRIPQEYAVRAVISGGTGANLNVTMAD